MMGRALASLACWLPGPWLEATLTRSASISLLKTAGRYSPYRAVCLRRPGHVQPVCASAAISYWWLRCWLLPVPSCLAAWWRWQRSNSTSVLTRLWSDVWCHNMSWCDDVMSGGILFSCLSGHITDILTPHGYLVLTSPVHEQIVTWSLPYNHAPPWGSWHLPWLDVGLHDPGYFRELIWRLMIDWRCWIYTLFVADFPHGWRHYWSCADLIAAADHSERAALTDYGQTVSEMCCVSVVASFTCILVQEGSGMITGRLISQLLYKKKTTVLSSSFYPKIALQ